MAETLSIQIDLDTRKRLEAISKRSKRSAAVLASEAITAFVESEEWQLSEIQSGIDEIESGDHVDHEKVSKWLRSWGKARETKPPR